jgi:peroxiredoxin
VKSAPFRSAFIILGSVLLAGVLAGVALLATGRTGGLTHAASAGVPGPACDLQGNPVDPLRHIKGRAVVLIFLAIDCPICNKYAPEIRRLHDEYSSKGVKIWVVYPDPDTLPKSILRHQAEYHLPPQALLDPTHSLVGLSQATVTPEAAVFLPDRRLVYHGRIDNREVVFGSTRPEATEHDLRRVLQRIVQGQTVTPSSTPSVGCYIPGNE